MRTYLYPQKSCAISVIIPMYNVEEYIGECLDSLLMQTFQDFEVIVVDDCSTDNSVAVAKSYAPKFNGRFRLGSTKKNSCGGGYVPRNIGVNMANGKYIQFLDADDFLLGTALETLYNAAEEYKVDVVYTSACYHLMQPNDVYLRRDGIGRKLLKENKEDTITLIVDDSKQNLDNLFSAGGEGNFHAPWSKFIRHEFLLEEQIKFPEIVTGGDLIWVINVYCHAKRFLRIPMPFYFYRRHNLKSVTYPKGTSAERISYTFVSFVAWFKSLQELLNKTAILETNPMCPYEASKSAFQYRLHLVSEVLKQVSAQNIYEILRREFAKEDFPDYTSTLLPFLFSFIDETKKSADKQAAKIPNKFEPHLAGRIDIKFMSTEGDFQIISKSDEKAAVWTPDWIKKDGMGYAIRSLVGELEFTTKATADGQIRLWLKGMYVRDADNKLIPHWIDYTKFAVNDKVIFDALTPAWQNKPYLYKIDAKAGEEIKFRVEWLPHSEANAQKLLAETPKKVEKPALSAPTVAQKPVESQKKLNAPKPAITFDPNITARIDIKLVTTAGDFKILSHSDYRAAFLKSAWLQKDGVGYEIRSSAGILKFTAKATADGQIFMWLRGMRVPGSDNKLIPYWLDYTKLIINDKVVFDGITPAWHDKSYKHNFGVKAGDEITVQVEWLPHKSDA